MATPSDDRVRVRLRLYAGRPHERGEILAEELWEMPEAMRRFRDLLTDPRREGGPTHVEADVPDWVSNPAAEAVRQQIRPH